MGLTASASKMIGGRALDRAADDAALRLADVTRRGVEQLVSSRGLAIAASVDAFALRTPGAQDREIEELLIRDRRWRGAARGALSGLPSLIPGAGTAVAVATGVVDSAGTLYQQAELALALCHLRGLDVRDAEARRTDVLLVLAMGADVLRIKDGTLLFGDEPVGADGVVSDEVVARLSRAIGETVVKQVVRRRAAILAGRLFPLGIGVAVAAGGDYLALRSTARAARRYLDWRARTPAKPAAR